MVSRPSLLMTGDMWSGSHALSSSSGSFVVLDGVADLAAVESAALVNRLIDDFLTVA